LRQARATGLLDSATDRPFVSLINRPSRWGRLGPSAALRHPPAPSGRDCRFAVERRGRAATAWPYRAVHKCQAAPPTRASQARRSRA